MKKPSQKTRLIRENIAQTPFREHSKDCFCLPVLLFPMRDGGGKICETAADYITPDFQTPRFPPSTSGGDLEGGEAALSTASGMAAILATVMGICQAGDKIVCGANAFGSTLRLLDNFIGKFSVTVEYVNSAKTEDWDRAITSDTVLLLWKHPPIPPIQC